MIVGVSLPSVFHDIFSVFVPVPTGATRFSASIISRFLLDIRNMSAHPSGDTDDWLSSKLWVVAPADSESGVYSAVIGVDESGLQPPNRANIYSSAHEISQ